MNEEGEFPALVSLASSRDYLMPATPDDADWEALPAMPAMLVSRRASRWTAPKEPTMLMVDPDEAPILIRVPSAEGMADLLAAQNIIDLDGMSGADESAAGTNRSRYVSLRRSALLQSSDSFVLSPDDAAEIDEKLAAAQQPATETVLPTTVDTVAAPIEHSARRSTDDAKRKKRRKKPLPIIIVTKPPINVEQQEAAATAETKPTTEDDDEDVTLSFATVLTTDDVGDGEALVEIVVVPETTLSWWQRNVSEPSMQRLHRFGAYWPTLFYALSQAYDQLWAILPILLYVVLFRLALLDHQALDNAGVVLLGLLSVVFGLFLFMEGLNFAMMPLGEVIGKHMGASSLWRVLVFVFVLGILCTLCEPAINALQSLGNTVSRERSPHLYYLVHDWVDFWFMMVAVGVGLASVLGVVRIRKRWSLKPIVFVLVPLTVTLSCVGVWALDVDLSDIVALAWDCGGITTGPVTVPILIAFGVGAGSNRAPSDDVHAGQLEGFGIVTIAALVPIITVILQGMLLANLYTSEAILDEKLDDAAADGMAPSPYGGISIVDATPWREMIISVRSVLPLAVFFLLTLRFALRKPLPRVLVSLDERRDVGGRPNFQYQVFEKTTTASSSTNSQKVIIKSTVPSAPNSDDDVDHQFHIAAVADHPEMHSATNSDDDDSQNRGAIVDLTIPPLMKPIPTTRTVGGRHAHKVWLVQLIAVCCALVGSVFFNVGLTFGLEPLGVQMGVLLPASFASVVDVARAPFFSFEGGIVVLLFFSFVLGLLTTFAEPGLFAVGRKIEMVTNGEVKAKALVAAVAVGVSIGMSLGILRVALHLEFIYFLLALYSIALLLTAFSDEAIVNIAWDVAGMTTGPITVPFVLSLGLHVVRATGGEGGFGILGISSVCPIITVLGLSTFARLKSKFSTRR